MGRWEIYNQILGFHVVFLITLQEDVEFVYEKLNERVQDLR